MFPRRCAPRERPCWPVSRRDEVRSIKQFPRALIRAREQSARADGPSAHSSARALYKMKCPNCNNDIAYGKSWKISRWTSIECPKCQTLCNRSLDLKIFLVSLLSMIVFIGVLLAAILIIIKWGIIPGIIFGIAFTLLWMWFVLYLDGRTMSLVPAEKRKGIAKVLGHKIIKDNNWYLINC